MHISVLHTQRVTQRIEQIKDSTWDPGHRLKAGGALRRRRRRRRRKVYSKEEFLLL